MMLSSIASVTGGILQGRDCRISGVSIDSRQMPDSGLFVAIPGEKFDGHAYVKDAVDNGAVGALVSHPVDFEISQIAVTDTTIALGRLAREWRRRFRLQVAGITGSNGKTTVTAMLRAILAISGNPLSPRESFNNQWGVPLTLLGLRDTHSHAVIEMGMNHPGEIDYLTRIAQPTVILINNAAEAHLEGLGTLDAVARAKGEIIAGLSPDGVAVLNKDDPYFEFWRGLAGERRIISFSLKDEPDISATDIRPQRGGIGFRLQGEAGEAEIGLRLPGRHNVLNALAAIAVSYGFKVSLADMAQGLEAFDGVPGRLRRTHTVDGATLIDDSFNANPASMSAAIEVLAGESGRRLLILGGMAELGEDSNALHVTVGKQARKAGIDRLLVLDDHEHMDLKGYRLGFGKSTEVFHDVESLVAAIAEDATAGNTLLVKGSKSSAMGRVVKAIECRAKAGGAGC